MLIITNNNNHLMEQKIIKHKELKKIQNMID